MYTLNEQIAVRYTSVSQLTIEKWYKITRFENVDTVRANNKMHPLGQARGGDGGVPPEDSSSDGGRNN